MNIISLINYYTNIFNEIFSQNLTPVNLESKIRNAGDTFTLKLYEDFLNFIDSEFKKSKFRKEKYYVKETRKRSLITSIGYITFNSTSYIDKHSKERFVLLRKVLDIKPYQRLTNEAEYQLIKYAMSENMSQSARHALRNTIVSRSTVSKKISKLNGSIVENISKCNIQPDVLYIEMDEIHANLQHGGNKLCPCAIVHEGYEENFVKRKKLKNIRNFASATLNYEQLWEVIYDYVDKKYDIDKFKAIFISGDGAPGIKAFHNCFPNAIFVLDNYHYQKKHLNYIFKNDPLLTKYADDYLRLDNISDFKLLVKFQIEKYPEQEKSMKEHMNYIINNLDGIKNQKHTLYNCHCSMEGHVSNLYARHITSSPYGFSINGLNNKLKLLVYKANNIDLSIEDFYNLKFGNDYYLDILNNINSLTNFKYDQNLSCNYPLDYNINFPIPRFDSNIDNCYLNNLLSFNNELPYIININDYFSSLF